MEGEGTDVSFNVYVTRRIPKPGLDLLEAECENVEVNPDDRCLTRAEMLEAVRGRDGILSLLTDRIDEEVLDAAKGARGFANCAVGYNNFDLAAATARGLVITNTPGVLTDATADMAWALLLAAGRRVVESDAFMRAGKFKSWAPMDFLGADLSGQSLGIVGAGRIGAAVARRSLGFNMNLLYCDPVENEELERDLNARRVGLGALLEEADFVSVHVSLDKKTHHLFGAEQFRRMKSSAVFVNTSRGPVVDEAALVDALRAGEIAAAGLDVYEDEPLMKSGLAELDNAVLCPHIASATVRTRTRMAVMAAQNLLAMLKGERAPNCVNPEVYERNW